MGPPGAPPRKGGPDGMGAGWAHVPRPFAMPQPPPSSLLGDAVPGHHPASAAPLLQGVPSAPQEGTLWQSHRAASHAKGTPPVTLRKAYLIGVCAGGSRDRPCPAGHSQEQPRFPTGVPAPQGIVEPRGRVACPPQGCRRRDPTP